MSRITKCERDECQTEFDCTDRAYQAQGSDGLFCSEHCAGRFDGLKGPHTNVPLEELPPRHWPAQATVMVPRKHWPAQEAVVIDEETGFEVVP